MSFIFAELLYVYYDLIYFTEKHKIYELVGGDDNITIGMAMINYLLFH